MPLTITFENNQYYSKALTLSKSLGLELARVDGMAEDGYFLLVGEKGLQLIQKNKKIIHCVMSDFLKGPVAYRRVHSGKNQDLAKAVGIKTYKSPLSILDLTAGLGKDAFILASLGCRLHLVERSPIIAALLLDGLERALKDKEICEIVRLMSVTVEDSKNILKNLERENCPDIVYIDPMFPSKEKNSLPKIAMRLIRTIVGSDLDADELIPLALKKARKRVVVKRHIHASCLFGLQPDFQVKGKSNRYDVYLVGSAHNE